MPGGAPAASALTRGATGAGDPRVAKRLEGLRLSAFSTPPVSGNPRMGHEVTILSGQLVDVRRIATVHGGGSSSHVSIWTAERYEIWIRPEHGYETQIIIWSGLFPARLGHHVTLLLDDGVVQGLINWSTRRQANYQRIGRFAALGAGDLAFIIVFLCTATLFSGGEGFPGFALLAVLYALTAQFLRARRTDAQLDKLIEQWRWRSS